MATNVSHRGVAEDSTPIATGLYSGLLGNSASATSAASSAANAASTANEAAAVPVSRATSVEATVRQ